MRYPIPLIMAAFVVTAAAVIVLHLHVTPPVLWTNVENNTVYNLVAGQGVGIYLGGRTAQITSNVTATIYYGPGPIPVVIYAAKPENASFPYGAGDLVYENGVYIYNVTWAGFYIVYQQIVPGVYVPVFNTTTLQSLGLLSPYAVTSIDVYVSSGALNINIATYGGYVFGFGTSTLVFNGTSVAIPSAQYRVDPNLIVDFGAAVYIVPSNNAKVTIS